MGFRSYLYAYAIFFPLVLTMASLAADPWGKDADLVQAKREADCQPQAIATPFLGQLGETLIRFHQEVISPCDGPRSHFIPSSSQYTLDAMRRYGFFKGFTMGCDRLMRENDERWVYRTIPVGDSHVLKWDPVPPRP